ncbi:MAG: phospholipid carrier-dependent glycosyltransferase [bacterium]
MTLRKQVILLILLILFAFISRGLFLDQPAGTVFDEVHYVKAARAYVAGQPDTNWEHPPLGKMCIALGIVIFGDNALGWRFFSYLLGCLAVILVFLLARALGLGWGAALFAGAFYATDFMAFIQGRMAMLDLYVAFFSLLALFFAARFYRTRWRLDFLFTLIALGFALASKWSAAYLVVALGVFFLVFPPFRLSRRAGLSFLANGLLVFLAFLVVVGGLYLLCYSYYFSFGNDFADLIKLHTDAWAWHTRAAIDHPYASPWWSWPLMTKGVWYAYLTNPAGLTEGILAIGNPIVWYGGGIALLALLASLPWWVRRRSAFLPGFVLFAFLVNYLPWIISSKGGFIFYMLPGIPFYALALAILVQKGWRRPVARVISWAVLVLAVLAFLAFYPLLTGLPVYPEGFLKGIWAGSFLGIFR